MNRKSSDRAGVGHAPPTSRGGSTPRDYVPLRDYAAIGDCHGGALIARDGSVDWCCLNRFDADPVFARILDAERGGYCSITVEGLQRVIRQYEPDTNILRTEFVAPGGAIAVTDFMAVGRARAAGPYAYTDLVAPGWLIRRIEVISGVVDITCAYRPNLGFSPESPRLTVKSNAELGSSVECNGSPTWLHGDMAFELQADHAQARIPLMPGDRRYLVIGETPYRPTSTDVDVIHRVTHAFWQEWLKYSRYRGPYRAMVERSALTLKLLTYAPTGASVAALTTSLPEVIGGERNWDYRFCWVRDASLGSHALSALGYAGESEELYQFLEKPLHGPVEDLQVMYGINLELDLEEHTLPQWNGYGCSRPVRIGNGAYKQRQTDLYGYLFEGACIHQSLGGKLTEQSKGDLARVVTFIAQCWKEPDMGLWEMRGPPRNFVHSKAMCWVVVQRAIDLLGERPDWLALRDEIWHALWTRGRLEGHFVQAFDQTDPHQMDAALLQVPLLGLPIDKATITATRKMVERELRHGDFVRRYNHDGDGLQGNDGAFLACSFWLVDCLLVEGEIEEATALFERLLTHANDLGLYSEEIDQETNTFLGNFPQAFTHFSLVNSAVNIELCRKHGAKGLAGDYADRVKRSAWATHGWLGMVAHALRSGRRNIMSSKASRWPAHIPMPPARPESHR